MPTDDGVRLYDDQGIAPSWPQATKENPEETVARGKRWACSLLLEDGELLSQCGILDCEVQRAMEAREERTKKCEGPGGTENSPCKAACQTIQTRSDFEEMHPRIRCAIEWALWGSNPRPWD